MSIQLSKVLKQATEDAAEDNPFPEFTEAMIMTAEPTYETRRK